MSRMSAGRTVISQHIPSNRVINQFPKPFRADCTPHKEIDFHPKVKNACSENRIGRVGLRICKAVLVGDVSVGKTALVNRFCHEVFEKDYKATIGVDFEVEKFSVLACPFTLQIWDTAGQERFKCIAASYYRGANVVIVVFDLSDESSITNLVRWMDDACENADQPIKFIVGSKKDLVSQAAYSQVESRVKMIANNLGAEYWAVSSKTGENVQEFFFRAVSLTFDAAVLSEVDTALAPRATQIGTIKVEQKDLYESRKRKISLQKCCNH
ncbi:hypothetical protein ACJMK2_011283 [Sinanodonta woodiana]|uniref:Ras-related protein Rab-36 n=1 Tax=Sinanodonta woodiana TaxID=1069815 RepID=A0ABD3V6X6_SINWO